ncbi:hypothetical protein THRCLA_06288 [Thraustotheca clavata]|uniref:Uncharacterized protein n=1 Tax=Thraustotheca clavata TaxID=74557 RepID=A0A1V9ZPU8_9STRA|nr:hypothetical protein THRCLA_06288 [Thraustotheca clavata]
MKRPLVQMPCISASNTPPTIPIDTRPKTTAILQSTPATVEMEALPTFLDAFLSSDRVVVGTTGNTKDVVLDVDGYQVIVHRKEPSERPYTVGISSLRSLKSPPKSSSTTKALESIELKPTEALKEEMIEPPEKETTTTDNAAEEKQNELHLSNNSLETLRENTISKENLKITNASSIPPEIKDLSLQESPVNSTENIRLEVQEPTDSQPELSPGKVSMATQTSESFLDEISEVQQKNDEMFHAHAIQLQRMYRGHKGRKHFQKTLYREAQLCGVLGAMPGTSQGSTGWYQEPRTNMAHYFVVLPSGEWKHKVKLHCSKPVLTKYEMHKYVLSTVDIMDDD